MLPVFAELGHYFALLKTLHRLNHAGLEERHSNTVTVSILNGKEFTFLDVSSKIKISLVITNFQMEKSQENIKIFYIFL